MVPTKSTLKLVFFLATLCSITAGQASRPAEVRTITVKSEPSAIVWIDDIRYGRTGKDGTLMIKTVARGAHTLRLRADGFKETTKSIMAAQKGDIAVPLVKTEDKAELKYQEAERLSSTDKDAAIQAYRDALQMRPVYTRAYIGLARALSENDDAEGALKTIRDLRKTAPASAEASAVEGRIRKDTGDEDRAIAAFRRSIAEGKGFQPEAYTGLGLLYNERAEGAGAKGDLVGETANYDLAARNFRLALKQLSGAPDARVLYQLIGLVLERQQKYAEAIELYQEFLRFFPDSNDAPAVQSFIDQLRKQMAQPKD